MNTITTATNANWVPGEPRFGKPTWTAWVPVGQLATKKGNPEERHNPDSNKQGTQKLKKAVENAGGPIQSITACGRPGQAIYPTPDGNTRVAIAKKLYGKDFKVLVVLVDEDENKVFRTLNGEGKARPLASEHKPLIFLKHEEMLVDNDRDNLRAMLEVVGKETFEVFAKSGKSYATYRDQALPLARFCGFHENGQIATVLRWLCKHRVTAKVDQGIVRPVRQGKATKYTKEQVVAAIIGDRPLA